KDAVVAVTSKPSLPPIDVISADKPSPTLPPDL
ncbi:hypothetical protein A2U01_0042997, partial [Trifolium medium]|nr:hypothetical protein [Trifolium medium]